MKKGILTALLLSISVILFTAMAIVGKPGQTKNSREHTLIVMRSIGHRLLLGAGDSTSLVLPVNTAVEDAYILEFQNSFSFVPDTLVKIIRDELACADISPEYRVNVFECKSLAPVYGFEVTSPKQSIIPCLGRTEPKRCYKVEVVFNERRSVLANTSFYLLAVAGFVVFVSAGRSLIKSGSKKIETSEVLSEKIQIGIYYLSVSKRTLENDGETIELSEKEATLLSILANSKNNLVSRDQLLKEVWEDHGVFTGRSLDMFISKLRKKLQKDPSVQITNVHGRGYKLVTL